MTTLVRGDDMPSGRVLPKVFADVPSAEEIKAANEAVRRAKGTTRNLVVVTVLLAGALVAAIAFLAFTLSNPATGDFIKERDAARAEVVRLSDDVKRLKGDVATEKAAAKSVRDTYASYGLVANLENGLAESRETIRKLLEQAPGAQGVADRDGWNAYKNLTKWTAYSNTGDWKAYVAENLQRQQTQIDALKVKIDRFIQNSGIVLNPPPAKICPDNKPDC